MSRNRPDPANIREKLSKDLLALHQILKEDNSGVIVDVDGLLSAVNAAKRNSRTTTWEYEVADLRLRVKTPQRALPLLCGDFLDISMHLDIKGSCEDSTTDCVKNLILDLKISTESGENVCCWHFDRHITNDDGTETLSSEAHPLYHFQHGGHSMVPHAEFLGRGLLLPAPRLPFPPMDAVLSLDFVLSNFSGSCWRELRSNPTYIRLLQEAQQKHWKPYFEKIASWWATGPKDTESHILWPHLA